MTTRVRVGLVVATLVAVVIAVLSFPHRNATPKKDQNTLDSLRITHPMFEALRDTLILRETTYVRRVDTLVRYANQLDANASTLHKTADSLAGVARSLPETVTVWRRAYEVRSQEADTLRKALFVTRSALENEQQARAAADLRADATSARLTVSENLNTRLANDIRSASECKFLWMRCPSRPAVFATGAILGAGVAYVGVRILAPTR